LADPTVGDQEDPSTAEGSALSNIDVASVFSEILRHLHAAGTIAEVDAIVSTGIRSLQEIKTPGDLSDYKETFADLLGQHRTLRVTRITRKARGEADMTADFRTAGLSEEALTSLGLTRREIEVLDWITHGKRDAEIATILGISARTIGKHVENILRKLQVENRSAAVAAARNRKA
jgi:DNA-binding CsgD family transcriptional regulator